jgi:hypothetical protein
VRKTRPKSLLASEAVPSMPDARRDRFHDGLAAEQTWY